MCLLMWADLRYGKGTLWQNRRKSSVIGLKDIPNSKLSRELLCIVLFFPISLCSVSSVWQCRFDFFSAFVRGFFQKNWTRALIRFVSKQVSGCGAGNRTRTCTLSQWNLNPPSLPIPPCPHIFLCLYFYTGRLPEVEHLA